MSLITISIEMVMLVRVRVGGSRDLGKSISET